MICERLGKKNTQIIQIYFIARDNSSRISYLQRAEAGLSNPKLSASRQESSLRRVDFALLRKPLLRNSDNLTKETTPLWEWRSKPQQKTNKPKPHLNSHIYLNRSTV